MANKTVWYLMLLVLAGCLGRGSVKFAKLGNRVIKDYGEVDGQRLEKHYRNLIVERVVDTKGHRQVRDYIVSQFDEQVWDVEVDTFEHDTIVGKRTFANVIVTSKLTEHTDPHSQTLLLGAHYDSKILDEGKFVAAVDSAVPCAMLIDIAHSMQDLITEKAQRRLQLVFFDGEEAFKEWTDTDSLYGSRHLAHKLSNKHLLHNNQSKAYFESLDLFVLLDLIGAPSPTFYYFDEKTLPEFKHLSQIEDHLVQKRVISYKPDSLKYFKQQHLPHDVQDDHIPFLKHKVPVLHIIPIPFPKVWHTVSDTYENLDHTTTNDLLKIFKIFTATYLNYQIKH